MAPLYTKKPRGGHEHLSGTSYVNIYNNNNEETVTVYNKIKYAIQNVFNANITLRLFSKALEIWREWELLIISIATLISNSAHKNGYAFKPTKN